MKVNNYTVCVFRYLISISTDSHYIKIKEEKCSTTELILSHFNPVLHVIVDFIALSFFQVPFIRPKYSSCQLSF
jgi:hypothetical protein